MGYGGSNAVGGGGVIAENEDSVKKIFHIQIVLHHVLLTIGFQEMWILSFSIY